MGKWAKFPRLAVLLILAALTGLVAFQNCSNVRLAGLKIGKEIPSVVGQDGERLPIPTREQGNARIVIVMDQSFSMVWNKCPEDLDGTSPSPTGAPFSACERTHGVDYAGNRFEVIRAWLDELAGFESNPGDVKVMLLPFSGGKAKRPSPSASPVHGLRDQDRMKFLDLETTGTWLSALKLEQEATIADGSREIMGTTVFDPILDYAQAKIVEEAQILKAQNKLATTPFVVVMLTDGAYKPTQELFGLLRQVSGCPDCSVEPDHIACTCFYGGCWSGPGMTPGRYCQMLEQNFREYIGDPEQNTLEEVKRSLNSVLDLERDPDFPGFRVSLRFAKINWTQVPVEDKNTQANKKHNLFEEIQNNLSRSVKVYNISTAEPPFPILPGGGDGLTYVINNLYAINTNAFVDRYGNLVADSDGDGLDDASERQRGLNPSKPRTNDICLDGIVAQFGCQKLGCRADIDMDGDGLNECEEVTIGTRVNLFDSDMDHIPDILEALRFLKPSEDDSLYKSSGDSLTDHEHFRRGVHPLRVMSSVLEKYRVSLLTWFLNYEMVEDTMGVEYAVGKYRVDLQNMPLVPTAAVSRGDILDLKVDPSQPVLGDLFRMDPLAKSVNTNRAYFLMEISTLENPNRLSWHLLKMDIPVPPIGGTFSLPEGFSFSRFTQIKGETL